MDIYNSFTRKTTLIQNDYELNKSRELGKGMSGAVVVCRSKKSNKEYALKTLDDSVISKYEIGLQLKASKGCENIVKIIDVYENEIERKKKILVVMELMTGGELLDFIQSRKNPLTEKVLGKIMCQLCIAVKHLHDLNIAHRDLKPENVLLSSSEEDAIVKLGDFGFAKDDSDGLNTPLGSNYYFPPEILRHRAYDKSCDIWSLGVLMYIMCCGYPPFFSNSERTILNSPGMRNRIINGVYRMVGDEWTNVSNEAKDLIRNMLIVDPDARITIKEILDSEWLNAYTKEASKKKSLLLASFGVLVAGKDQRKNMLVAIDEDLKQKRKPVKKMVFNEAENPLLQKRLQKKGNQGPIVPEKNMQRN